jgi:hypothetical protein
MDTSVVHNFIKETMKNYDPRTSLKPGPDTIHGLLRMYEDFSEQLNKLKQMDISSLPTYEAGIKKELLISSLNRNILHFSSQERVIEDCFCTLKCDSSKKKKEVISGLELYLRQTKGQGNFYREYLFFVIKNILPQSFYNGN